MAFKQFPHIQYYRTLNSDAVTRVGYFNVPQGTELNFITVWAYVMGIIPSPIQFRLNIYGNDEQASPIFSSDWAELSAATLLNNDFDPPIPYTDNWTGYFNVDFPGYPLNPNINYFVSVETSGYTRVGDTFYLGVNLDWYSETNNQIDGPDEAGLRIAVNGFRP